MVKQNRQVMNGHKLRVLIKILIMKSKFTQGMPELFFIYKHQIDDKSNILLLFYDSLS